MSSGTLDDGDPSDSGDESSSDGTDTGEPEGQSYRCGDPRLSPMPPSFAAPITLQGNDGTGGTAAGDLDGDGRDEFVGQILFKIYDLDGGRWQSYQPLANLNGRGNRFAGDLEIADMNNDGALDIIVPDSNNTGVVGGLSWFQDPGSLAGDWAERLKRQPEDPAESRGQVHGSLCHRADCALHQMRTAYGCTGVPP